MSRPGEALDAETARIDRLIQLRRRQAAPVAAGAHLDVPTAQCGDRVQAVLHTAPVPQIIQIKVLMAANHKEEAFREAILAGMRERGWEVGQPSHYQADLGLAPDEALTFIGATQNDAWNKLLALYGDDADAAQQGFLRRLSQAITTDGVLEVLRNGVKDRGVRIRLAHFKPNLVESDDVLTNYGRTG